MAVPKNYSPLSREIVFDHQRVEGLLDNQSLHGVSSRKWILLFLSYSFPITVLSRGKLSVQMKGGEKGGGWVKWADGWRRKPTCRAEQMYKTIVGEKFSRSKLFTLVLSILMH